MCGLGVQSRAGSTCTADLLGSSRPVADIPGRNPRAAKQTLDCLVLARATDSANFAISATMPLWHFDVAEPPYVRRRNKRPYDPWKLIEDERHC